MAIFKCKMCGGSLEINNERVAICEYCGTQQTLPKLDDERKVNLYDRANHFRRNNEFDKAMGIYEQILNEDKTDAEAYWSLVLCRYGIEYVEDPTSHKRTPTVNRAQFTAVSADENFKLAVKYADPEQKKIYKLEAKTIDSIQKDILAISQKEEPFDIFICYKETDNNGRRTPDSVLATELYHELTKEGFKVFFSRITLEDKLGTAYEPYIFAALNSSKVMVAIGTKPEYFNAVWVKNEWSRYLALVKNGDKKILIPAYRDMDPYDLPEEFSHLQAQDMSKLGFMQDLIRGIKKIARAEAPKATVIKETVVTAGNVNAEPLLKRMFMFLEDEEWESADEYSEKVLDIDPEDAQAYLGKLMAELRVRTREELRECAEPFETNNNYQKVLRFADDKLKKELIGYINDINIRTENERLDSIYNGAVKAMAVANTEKSFNDAAHVFETINEYKNSGSLAKECYEKAEDARKDSVLDNAKMKMNSDTIADYNIAIELFESISGWKDADKKLAKCKKRIEEIKEIEETERLEIERSAEVSRIRALERKKLIKKIAIIATPFLCAAIVFIIVLNSVIIPNGKYNDAVDLMNTGEYIEAISAFSLLEGYKDSAAKIEECNSAIKEKEYLAAIDLMKSKKYDEAITAFEKLYGYKDSKKKIEECNTYILDYKYKEAASLLEQGAELKAAIAFGKLGDFSDARERSIEIWDKKAIKETLSAGSDHTVALKSDGKVVAVGDNSNGQCNVSGWSGIIEVSAGLSHTVGLKRDGTVIATQFVGDTFYNRGQCEVSDWSDITAISTGSLHTVGLKKDGTVVAVGSNEEGQCNVSSWTDIVAISSGSVYTVALKKDGTVVATGSNGTGQCNVSDWSDVIAIATGTRHTVGLKVDGTVVSTSFTSEFKYNYGQCEVFDWTDIAAISAGAWHTVGLKKDGTVVSTEFDSDDHYCGQCDVSDWNNVVAISANSGHTVGLKKDGTVVATKYLPDYDWDNGITKCDVGSWKNIKKPT